MTLPAVVPFKPGNPKSRLSCVLDERERSLFAGAMLRDVLEALHGAGCDPFVMSTAPFVLEGEQVVVNPAGLNESLNALLTVTHGPLLILMADLPLVNPLTVRRLIRTKEDIAIGPGRGGGTNAIFLRTASCFRVDYYQASFLKHLRIAGERGFSCEVIDSFRLHTDVDEKEDLVELLIHGTGESRSYLEGLGFSLSIEKGRVGVERRTD
jgi:2-phospho-L-lactate/phosphoenolpyruvate guanylyltransferase